MRRVALPVVAKAFHEGVDWEKFPPQADRRNVILFLFPGYALSRIRFRLFSGPHRRDL
ncbi:protein of unknown function [Hyphomicrobium sp. 1Nfss2.1]